VTKFRESLEINSNGRRAMKKLEYIELLLVHLKALKELKHE